LQFFITLEKTEWLDRQNTIFGKIVGDTVYNLLRIGECAVSKIDNEFALPYAAAQ
jgi:peptidyl-prolyl cis-trans isomerase SDCCAG10